MQGYSSNCSSNYIQSKEAGNKNYYEGKKENLKNGKVRFRLNIDFRKKEET